MRTYKLRNDVSGEEVELKDWPVESSVEALEGGPVHVTLAWDRAKIEENDPEGYKALAAVWPGRATLVISPGEVSIPEDPETDEPTDEPTEEPTEEPKEPTEEPVEEFATAGDDPAGEEPAPTEEPTEEPGEGEGDTTGEVLFEGQIVSVMTVGDPQKIGISAVAMASGCGDEEGGDDQAPGDGGESPEEPQPEDPEAPQDPESPEEPQDPEAPQEPAPGEGEGGEGDQQPAPGDDEGQPAPGEFR